MSDAGQGKPRRIGYRIVSRITQTVVHETLLPLIRRLQLNTGKVES